MKILMLTPYPPYPPHAGGRIRMWEQIRYLGCRHELTVVSFIFSDEEYVIKDILEDYCAQAIMVRRHKPAPLELRERPHLPRLIYEYRTVEMQKTLDGLKSIDFDIVLIEHIFMAQYHDLFQQPVILQEHNIESNVLRRFAELRQQSTVRIYEKDTHAARAFRDAKDEWKLMANYETQIWPKFPLRITVSEEDRRELNSRCKTGNTIVIENGVDTRHITPIAIVNNPFKILFIGTLDYYPNVDAVFYFIEEVFPIVRRIRPDISFVIAGRNPSPAIQDLANEPRIEVASNPEFMSEVANQCNITVVPMRFGGGTRLKILESMAMGLPVVSTSLGCEGLSVSDNNHIVVRDKPNDFADAVLQLASDSVLYDRLRENGRKLVEERYDWHLLLERLELEIISLTG